MRTESMPFVEFTTSEYQTSIFDDPDHVGGGTRVRLNPYTINSIRFPTYPAGVAIVSAGLEFVINAADAERIEQAAVEGNPQLLDDETLHERLELAERQYTRLLAEVQRRQP